MPRKPTSAWRIREPVPTLAAVPSSRLPRRYPHPAPAVQAHQCSENSNPYGPEELRVSIELRQPILQFAKLDALLAEHTFEPSDDFLRRAAPKRLIPELSFLRRNGFLQTLSLFLQPDLLRRRIDGVGVPDAHVTRRRGAKRPTLCIELLARDDAEFRQYGEPLNRSTIRLHQFTHPC